MKYIILFVFLFPFFASAQSEVEPNGTTSTATLLVVNQEMLGTIGTNGDKDVYRFVIDRSIVINVSLLGVPANLELQLELLSNQEERISFINNRSNGSPLRMTQLLCEAGTYYLRINDYQDNENSADSYRLNFTLDGTDENECNNSFATATPMVLEEDMTGQILSVGDNDYYKVTIPSAGVLTAQVTGVGAEVEVQLALYRENEEQIRYVDNRSANRAIELVQGLCSAGVYYLRIKDYQDNESSTDTYRLITRLDTQDIYECNNGFSSATPIDLREELEAQINSAGDQDYYTLQIDSIGYFTASVTQPNSNVEFQLGIYDENENTVAYTDNRSANRSISSSVQVCTPGKYYVRVLDYQNNEASPDLYRLSTNLDTRDPYECNDGFSDAAPIALGDSIVAQVRRSGDLDYYLLQVTESGVLEVDIFNVANVLDLDINIYNDRQEDLAYANGASGQPNVLRYNVCESGEYFIYVRDGRSGNASETPYGMVTRLLTQDSSECNNSITDATPLSLCDTLTGYLLTNGDIDYYAFESDTTINVRAETFNVTGNVEMRLYLLDEQGNQVNFQFGSRGMNVGLNMTLQANERYFVYLLNGRSGYIDTPYRFTIGNDNDCTTAVSTYDQNFSRTIQLYPNPSTGPLFVSWADKYAVRKLSVFDAGGREVSNLSISHGATSHQLELGQLPVGTYWLRLETDHLSGSLTFIHK